MTYIVKVTKGGKYANLPQITVSTDKGIDLSGPTVVAAANVAVPVGNFGVTIKFNQTALCGKDVYTIPCQAATSGLYKTLVLGHNLPAAVINNGATEVDVSLFIRANIQLTQDRLGFAPQLNWTQTGTEFCTNSGIIAYDPSWTSGGIEQPLDVISESSQGYGKMYVEYRAWLQTWVNELGTISDSATFDTLLSGPDHPDNPLKYAVGKAFANSNGTPVNFTAVSDPTQLSDWEDVLGLVQDRRDTYGLVPLSHDPSVWDAYVAHVNSQSTAQFGAWRDVWFNLQGVAAQALVSTTSSTDGKVVLATLTDDPNTSGTQNTLLQVPLSNGGFLDNGVKAGDIVRFLFTTDGFSNDTYTEFVVSSVINEESLLLVAGNGTAVNTPQKVEVWRNLSSTEQATAIAKTNTFANRRVMLVWPDTLTADDQTVDGYFLCATLAGLASGVVPQQGLSNMPIRASGRSRGRTSCSAARTWTQWPGPCGSSSRTFTLATSIAAMP